MAISYGARYTDVSQIKGPSGFYNILIDGENIPVYVNQEYDGGGWVCVLANRINTAGMNNLSYYNAVNTCNYRTGGTTNGTNTVVSATSKLSRDANALSQYNIWIGLRYWSKLAKRNNPNYITVVQFVSTTVGAALNASHTKRYRWRFNEFTGTYSMSGVFSLSDETGTGSPGFLLYHAANGSNLTTYDLDQDTNSGNCATYYNNNPWWYSSCWSGNYFAGGSYQDAAYWVSSSTDYHNYGAVYIK